MGYLAGSDASWMAGWLGFDLAAPGIFDGYGDSGVATLVPDLENGFTVTHQWFTSIIKAAGGSEQRIARNTIAKESYEGTTKIGPVRTLELRALMARYAASGARWQLAMPHEGLALCAPAAGATELDVGSTADCDWMRPGQRAVVVTRQSGEPVGVDVVIQRSTTTTVTVDKAITAPPGALLMPTKPVYLESQQAFPRYRTRVEEWNLRARGATPLDYAPARASLALGSFASSMSLANAVVYARQTGLEPITFTLDGDSGHPDQGSLFEGFILGIETVIFRYKPGVTTFDDLLAALASSAFVVLVGVTNTSATMGAGDEGGGVLSGAAANGDVGNGATLTTYESLPVWDRKLPVGTTAEDGVHGMAEIIDHGGAPYALATADEADWYRSVRIIGGRRAAWQWFKLFTSTVRGCAGRFWLPTWRADLEYVSHNGNSLVIGAGDFSAWWPRLRRHVMIEQADGTITYAEITAASGTTLTISESLSASEVVRISWLESCRFENADSYQTTHDEHGFHVSLIARVVP